MKTEITNTGLDSETLNVAVVHADYTGRAGAMYHNTEATTGAPIGPEGTVGHDTLRSAMAAGQFDSELYHWHRVRIIETVAGIATGRGWLYTRGAGWAPSPKTAPASAVSHEAPAGGLRVAVAFTFWGL